VAGVDCDFHGCVCFGFFSVLSSLRRLGKKEPGTGKGGMARTDRPNSLSLASFLDKPGMSGLKIGSLGCFLQFQSRHRERQFDNAG